MKMLPLDIEADKLLDDYEMIDWGHSVAFPTSTVCAEKEIREILLVNFWQSLWGLKDDQFISPWFKPRFEIEKRDEHIVASWKCYVFKKKSKET